MIDPESVLVNETHQYLWDFGRQADQQISARRPNFILINNKKKKKRTCRIVDFAVPADHRVQVQENEKKDLSFFSLSCTCFGIEKKKKNNNKTVELVSDGDTSIAIGALGTVWRTWK